MLCVSVDTFSFYSFTQRDRKKKRKFIQENVDVFFYVYTYRKNNRFFCVYIFLKKKGLSFYSSILYKIKGKLSRKFLLQVLYETGFTIMNILYI